jgi:hypothetical protein
MIASPTVRPTGLTSDQCTSGAASAGGGAEGRSPSDGSDENEGDEARPAGAKGSAAAAFSGGGPGAIVFDRVKGRGSAIGAAKGRDALPASGARAKG